jgi:hypothetical protein
MMSCDEVIGGRANKNDAMIFLWYDEFILWNFDKPI